MEAVRIVTGRAIAIEGDNIDTDRMLPSRFLLKPRAVDYSKLLFHDLRASPASRAKFPFDDPRYAGAKILVGGRNFGCGSAREQAVYGMLDFGTRALVAVSFGDIFKANCVNNGLLPAEIAPEHAEAMRSRVSREPETLFTIDLKSQVIEDVSGTRIPFEIDPGHREQLLTGTDLIDQTSAHLAEIAGFEERYYSQMPWAKFDSRTLNAKSER